MNLKSLRVFTYVIEDATLARAAARLNLSQSAASRLLTLLEEEFAVTLFRRDRKRLVPTAAAERFYPEAVRILSQIAAIPALFDEAHQDTRPPLRIICQTRIQNALVLPAMAALSAAQPHVPMKLEVRPRRDLGRLILTDQYDVGISTLPLPVHGLQPQALGAVRLSVLLPSRHPLAAKASLSATDLAQMPYIALDRTTIVRQLADRTLAQMNQALEITHEVSTGDAAYRLVREGLGFTFADPVAVAPDLAARTALVPWDAEAIVTYGYFVSTQGQDHPAMPGFLKIVKAAVAAARAEPAGR